MDSFAEKELNTKKEAAARAAVWYSLATIVTKGLTFITIPLFTRLMTTGEFGLFNNYAAWQAIMLPIISLEGYSTLNRARFDIHGKELQDYQFTVLTSGMSLALLLLISLFAFPWVAEFTTDLQRDYLYALVLYLMFYPAFNMFQMLQRVQYHYKLSACLSLGTSLLATILSVFLVVEMPDALMGRIIGQYAPFVLLGIALYLWYFKTGGHFKVAHLRYALRLCLPLVIAALGTQILLLGCRVVTQHSAGADQVAFLSLATTISQISLILIGALNNAWAPWLYDCLEANQLEKAGKTFSIYVWGLVLLVLSVSMLAPELVLLLGGERYMPAIWLVPSFMSTCLFSMLINQYVYLETYYKDVAAGGIITLVFGLANLLLCWFFINVFGFESVGYANVITNALLVVAHRFIVRNYDGAVVFSLSTIGLPLFVGLLSMPVAVFLYADGITPVRLLTVVSLLIIILLFSLRKRNTLKSNL